MNRTWIDETILVIVLFFLTCWQQQLRSNVQTINCPVTINFLNHEVFYTLCSSMCVLKQKILGKVFPNLPCSELWENWRVVLILDVNQTSTHKCWQCACPISVLTITRLRWRSLPHQHYVVVVLSNPKPKRRIRILCQPAGSLCS